mgnify:CR=1 FL=1
MNSKGAVRFSNRYGDLLGVTKSLRIGTKNFICHFPNRADEEWLSDQRDEIIALIQALHASAQTKPLWVFGVTSGSLSDYLTSESDVIRHVCRMPSSDYLISENKISSNIN